MSENEQNEGQNQNLHGSLPAGAIRFQPPPPQFPADLTASLDSARRSDGKYMVAVWNVSDDGNTIHMQVTRGGGWSFDWTFRGFAMFRDNMLASQLPADGGNGGNGKSMGNN